MRGCVCALWVVNVVGKRVAVQPKGPWGTPYPGTRDDSCRLGEGGTAGRAGRDIGAGQAKGKESQNPLHLLRLVSRRERHAIASRRAVNGCRRSA